MAHTRHMATGGGHGGHESVCPIYQHAIELIGGRWTGAILRVLLGGTCRFSELTACIPGLSDRLLSERLKELEAERIVERTVIPSIPVRVEYGLTPKGRALGAVIGAVSTWAHDWLAPGGGQTDAFPEACAAEAEPATATAGAVR